MRIFKKFGPKTKNKQKNVHRNIFENYQTNMVHIVLEFSENNDRWSRERVPLFLLRISTA